MTIALWWVFACLISAFSGLVGIGPLFYCIWHYPDMSDTTIRIGTTVSIVVTLSLAVFLLSFLGPMPLN